MLDVRAPLPLRGLLFAAGVLLAATNAGADAQDSTASKSTAPAKAASTIQGPAQLSAAQRAARALAAGTLAAQQTTMVQQPAVRRWPAPQPCGGDSVSSRGGARLAFKAPELRGITLPAARERALRMTVDARYAPVPGRPNSIVSQAPPAGTPVAPGDTVVVCSYNLVRVPDVRGALAAQAQSIMGDSGFNSVVTTTTVPPGLAAGRVQRQVPTENSVAVPGSTVTLYIGVPQPAVYLMPDVRGRYLAAQDSLKALRDRMGYAISVTSNARKGAPIQGLVVDSQLPLPRTVLGSGTQVRLFVRDTTTKPPNSYTMPKLGGSYLAALESLKALRKASGFALPWTTSGAPDAADTRDRLIVAKQSPEGGTTLREDTTIFLFLRDPTPPPPPPVKMPPLKGVQMSVAMTRVQSLRKQVPFRFKRGLQPSAKLPFDSTRAIVDSQSPETNAILSAQSVVVLIFRDTTAVPPPVIMPNVVGRTIRSARDTLVVLRIPFSATAVDRDDRAGEEWIIARQSPRAGEAVTAATSVHLYATRPIPWLWYVASTLAVAAAAAAMYHHYGKGRVARMAVVPHVDRFALNMTLQVRGGETADEAFGRIGMSFTPVSDGGVAMRTRITLPSLNNRDHDV